MKDSKYARVTITIPEHLLEWIDRKAAKDDRPRSYIMAKMVEKIAKEVEAHQSAALSAKPPAAEKERNPDPTDQRGRGPVKKPIRHSVRR